MSDRTTSPWPLVSTAWLDDHRTDPDVQIVDATVHMHLQQSPPAIVSGRADYDAGHIPGAVFADILGDLSDQSASTLFMLPSDVQFAAAIGKLGIDNDCRVVIYSGTSVAWATRLWWMLRVYGFDNAMVLDGGFKKWVAEGRAVTSAPTVPRPATFRVEHRRHLVATKDDVLSASVGHAGKTCIIDALSAESYRGTSVFNYGRPGHIPGAINIPAASAIDADKGVFLSLDELRARFAPVLDDAVESAIVYCGGGVSATINAFALTMLGKAEVAVYDASLQEWARDERLPMTTASQTHDDCAP